VAEDPVGTVSDATVSRTGTTNRWILDPSATLTARTRYIVTLTAEATAITDLPGNPPATSRGPSPRALTDPANTRRATPDPADPGDTDRALTAS
jgi:hypothetical protein